MTADSFNLIDQPWLLARDLDGRESELSLLDVFTHADQLDGVTGELPTQTLATTRLLLAILHRAVEGPPDLDAWFQLWQQDQLPLDAISAYLDRFRDRFDLLHPATPFFQVADLHTKNDESFGLERLIGDAPVGRPYLTTRLAPSYDAISFAEAARWLVHAQAFDPSGIKSGAVGDDRIRGGKGYPIGVGWTGAIGGVMVEAATLRTTLLLNLIAADFMPEYRSEADLPPWELPAQSAAVDDPLGRPAQGHVDLYTWQSRRIRLFHDGTSVRRVLIANGDRREPQNQQRVEPMSAWRRSPNQERLRKEPVVYMPLLHDPDRSMWRGLAALLPAVSGLPGGQAAPFLPPPVIDWLAHLHGEDGVFERGFVARLRAIGMHYITNSTTVGDVIDDALSVHIELISTAHPEWGEMIVRGVEATDQAVGVLAGLANNLAYAAGGRTNSAGDSTKVAAYADLDQPFRHWLTQLNPQRDGADIHEARALLHATVAEELRRKADQLIRSASPQAWIGRSRDKDQVNTATAEVWFRRGLTKALPYSKTGRTRAISSPPEGVSA